MRFSTVSALEIARSAKFVASQRIGSGSHLGERWFTQGKLVRSPAPIGAPVINSVNVRPAKLVVATPSPT